MSSISDSHNALIRSICEHAADQWAKGSVRLAEQWFGAAVEEVGDSEFVDTDEATR
jgi:hypothetical protein